MVLLCALAALLAAAAGAHAGRGEECAFINNTDVAGANIKWEKKPNPSDCCDGCEATPGCKAAV